MWWKPTHEQRLLRLEKAVNGIFCCLKMIAADMEKIKDNLPPDGPRLVSNKSKGGI